MSSARAATVQLAALRDVLTLLSSAPTPDDVAAALAAPGLLPMRAVSASIWVVADRRLARVGTYDDDPHSDSRPPIDSVPLTGTDPAARAGLAATIVLSHSPEPDAPASLRVPIVSRGIVVGVYGADGAAEHPLTLDDITQLEAIADAIALWLDRGPRPGTARTILTTLTPRQQRVLVLVLAGSTNSAIAASLGSSPATVKAELRAVNGLLGTTDRRQAARRALELDLLVADDAR